MTNLHMTVATSRVGLVVTGSIFQVVLIKWVFPNGVAFGRCGFLCCLFGSFVCCLFGSIMCVCRVATWLCSSLSFEHSIHYSSMQDLITAFVCI